MQRFADIDIAEPGDDSLIQQRRLQARLLSLAGARQHGGVEFIAERFGAKVFQQRLGVEPVTRDELHRSEPARIVKGYARAGRHMEDDVIVGDVLAPLVIIAADRFVRFVKDMKRAGHAEMHDQHVAGRQIGKQIFGAPTETGHRRAFEPPRKILRQRPAQIAAVDVDPDEAFSLHGRFEAAAHRLDFGQFGHRLILPGGGNLVNFKHIASLTTARYVCLSKDQR